MKEKVTVHVLLYQFKSHQHIHLLLEKENGSCLVINRWQKPWDLFHHNYQLTPKYSLFNSDKLDRKIVPVIDDIKAANEGVSFTLTHVDTRDIIKQWQEEYLRAKHIWLPHIRYNCADAVHWFMQTFTDMPTNINPPDKKSYQLALCFFAKDSEYVRLPGHMMHLIRTWLGERENLEVIAKPTDPLPEIPTNASI